MDIPPFTIYHVFRPLKPSGFFYGLYQDFLSPGNALNYDAALNGERQSHFYL